MREKVILANQLLPHSQDSAQPNPSLADLHIQITDDVDIAGYLQLVLDRVSPVSSATAATVDPTLWKQQLRGACTVSHYPGWSLHMQQAEHHTIIAVKAGSCSMHWEDQHSTASQRAMLYLPPGIDCHLDSEAGMDAHWIHFDLAIQRANALIKEITHLPDIPWGVLPNALAVMLWPLVEQVTAEWALPWPETSLRCQSRMLELLSIIYSYVHEQSLTQGTPTRVALAQAKRFIETHTNEPFNLQQLSAHVALSSSYLAHLFKQTFGISPAQYHTDLRIQKAQALLQINDLAISEIAGAVGYASQQAFTRAFRRKVGLTPSDFRKRHQQFSNAQ